jgi:hypothetical protein
MEQSCVGNDSFTEFPGSFDLLWIYNNRLGKRHNNLHVAMPGQLPTLPGGRPVPSRCAIRLQPWGQQQSRRLAAGTADVFGLPWRQFGQAFSSEILQFSTVDNNRKVAARLTSSWCKKNALRLNPNRGR